MKSGNAPAVAGLLAVLLPAALLAAAVAAPEPSEPSGHRPAPPAAATLWSGWGAPERASLTALRRAVAAEAHRTAGAPARCKRALDARRCSLRALARTGAAAKVQGMLLRRLAAEGRPGLRCRRRIAALSGSVTVLGLAGAYTLRSRGVATSAELRASAGALRRMARATGAGARGPGWRRDCYSRRSPAASNAATEIVAAGVPRSSPANSVQTIMSRGAPPGVGEGSRRRSANRRRARWGSRRAADRA